MLVCPKCRSKDIESFAGGVSGISRCKNCGYIGTMLKAEWYEKFRWFFTSNNVLVIGGKNAEQNEQVVKMAKPNMLMLHTVSPGSPFCVLWQSYKKNKQNDIKEASVFCAAFSKEFKSSNNIKIHTFLKKNVKKQNNIKGSFIVTKIEKELSVKPLLSLVKQKGHVVAVPSGTAEKLNLKIYANITKGKTLKQKSLDKITKKVFRMFRLQSTKKHTNNDIEKMIIASLRQELDRALPPLFRIKFTNINIKRHQA